MTERLVAVASQRVMGYVTRQAGGRLSFAYDAGWRLAEIPDCFRSVVTAARCQGLDHPVVPALEDAVLARAGACLASLDA